MISKIIKVGADWCGPCRQLHKELENFPFPIQEINVDEDEEISEKYIIRSIPVLLFLDEQENEIQRHTGFIKREDLIKKLKELNANI